MPIIQNIIAMLITIVQETQMMCRSQLKIMDFDFCIGQLLDIIFIMIMRY